ncbi:hypothetical protein PR048_017465 [Dryococelus australis]|uniref:Uncharacterized protein n=1 Tax=Dryococelus australis TaxID=614101 RepID=A0ABQ9H9K9_9NEOP|nr:hypothetical protein PR048_017465 [Dryococelus australis]
MVHKQEKNKRWKQRGQMAEQVMVLILGLRTEVERALPASLARSHETSATPRRAKQTELSLAVPRPKGGRRIWARLGRLFLAFPSFPTPALLFPFVPSLLLCPRCAGPGGAAVVENNKTDSCCDFQSYLSKSEGEACVPGSPLGIRQYGGRSYLVVCLRTSTLETSAVSVSSSARLVRLQIENNSKIVLHPNRTTLPWRSRMIAFPERRGPVVSSETEEGRLVCQSEQTKCDGFSGRLFCFWGNLSADLDVDLDSQLPAADRDKSFEMIGSKMCPNSNSKCTIGSRPHYLGNPRVLPITPPQLASPPCWSSGRQCDQCKHTLATTLLTRHVEFPLPDRDAALDNIQLSSAIDRFLARIKKFNWTPANSQSSWLSVSVAPYRKCVFPLVRLNSPPHFVTYSSPTKVYSRPYTAAYCRHPLVVRDIIHQLAVYLLTAFCMSAPGGLEGRYGAPGGSRSLLESGRGGGRRASVLPPGGRLLNNTAANAGTEQRRRKNFSLSVFSETNSDLTKPKLKYRVTGYSIENSIPAVADLVEFAQRISWWHTGLAVYTSSSQSESTLGRFGPPTRVLFGMSVLIKEKSDERHVQTYLGGFFNIESLRADEGEARAGETRDPGKIRRLAASSGTIPTCENPGATPPGVEPASPSPSPQAKGARFRMACPYLLALSADLQGHTPSDVITRIANRLRDKQLEMFSGVYEIVLKLRHLSHWLYFEAWHEPYILEVALAVISPRKRRYLQQRTSWTSRDGKKCGRMDKEPEILREARRVGPSLNNVTTSNKLTSNQTTGTSGVTSASFTLAFILEIVPQVTRHALLDSEPVIKPQQKKCLITCNPVERSFVWRASTSRSRDILPDNSRPELTPVVPGLHPRLVQLHVLEGHARIVVPHPTERDDIYFNRVISHEVIVTPPFQSCLASPACVGLILTRSEPVYTIVYTTRVIHNVEAEGADEMHVLGKPREGLATARFQTAMFFRTVLPTKQTIIFIFSTVGEVILPNNLVGHKIPIKLRPPGTVVVGRSTETNRTVVEPADDIVVRVRELGIKSRAAVGVAVRTLGFRAGRCRWRASFLGDLPFPLVLTFRHCSILPLSALKASLAARALAFYTDDLDSHFLRGHFRNFRARELRLDNAVSRRSSRGSPVSPTLTFWMLLQTNLIPSLIDSQDLRLRAAISIRNFAAPMLATLGAAAAATALFVRTQQARTPYTVVLYRLLCVGTSEPMCVWSGYEHWLVSRSGTDDVNSERSPGRKDTQPF